jgi:hypothetical protein
VRVCVAAVVAAAAECRTTGLKGSLVVRRWIGRQQQQEL